MLILGKFKDEFIDLEDQSKIYRKVWILLTQLQVQKGKSEVWSSLRRTVDKRIMIRPYLFTMMSVSNQPIYPSISFYDYASVQSMYTHQPIQSTGCWCTKHRCGKPCPPRFWQMSSHWVLKQEDWISIFISYVWISSHTLGDRDPSKSYMQLFLCCWALVKILVWWETSLLTHTGPSIWKYISIRKKGFFLLLPSGDDEFYYLSIVLE